MTKRGWTRHVRKQGEDRVERLEGLLGGGGGLGSGRSSVLKERSEKKNEVRTRSFANEAEKTRGRTNGDSSEQLSEDREIEDERSSQEGIFTLVEDVHGVLRGRKSGGKGSQSATRRRETEERREKETRLTLPPQKSSETYSSMARLESPTVGTLEKETKQKPWSVSTKLEAKEDRGSRLTT